MKHRWIIQGIEITYNPNTFSKICNIILVSLDQRRKLKHLTFTMPEHATLTEFAEILFKADRLVNLFRRIRKGNRYV